MSEQLLNCYDYVIVWPNAIFQFDSFLFWQFNALKILTRQIYNQRTAWSIED